MLVTVNVKTVRPSSLAILTFEAIVKSREKAFLTASFNIIIGRGNAMETLAFGLRFMGSSASIVIAGARSEIVEHRS